MKVLIQLNDVNKHYGTKAILNNAGVSILEKQKIGVLGRNGAGKSTLARIITEEEDIDSGNVTRSNDLRIGYLQQKDPYQAEQKVIDFLLSYTGKEVWQCGKTAGRLGLKNELLNSTISSLPGGYRMRVKLAAMLLFEPNFLILDEPTNYLDLSTLILLENFLQSFTGGYMIISHDREFLKKTCSSTMEVDRGDIFMFPGNVDEYLAFKNEDREQKIRTNKNIENRQKEIQGFVDRFRAKASKATQVQSRIRQLEKMSLIDVPDSGPEVEIIIPQGETRPGIAFSVRDLNIGYNHKSIVDNIRFEVERGKKVAVLGDNGAGKSTLLKTLSGEIPPIDGEIKFSASLKVVHYAQHVYESIPEDKTVLAYLQMGAHPSVTPQQILDMAGAMLFRGDDTDKPIRVLSGGERARLSLASVLLSRSDILLLDEPTNHLDFDTVEALADALKKYSGTVIFVSHDRTFVSLTADMIVEIQNGSGRLYPGTYEDYVFHLTQRAEENNDDDESSDAKISRQNKTSDQENPSRYKLRKEASSELNKSRSMLQKIERKMEEIELERNTILTNISEDPNNYSLELNSKLENLTSQLSDNEENWMKLQETIESLESRIEELK